MKSNYILKKNIIYKKIDYSSKNIFRNIIDYYLILYYKIIKFEYFNINTNYGKNLAIKIYEANKII